MPFQSFRQSEECSLRSGAGEGRSVTGCWGQLREVDRTSLHLASWALCAHSMPPSFLRPGLLRNFLEAVSLLSLWLPSLSAQAGLIKNCHQSAKENIPTVQLDNGFASPWFPFICKSIQQTLKTESPEPDTVPVIKSVSNKYLNEKYSVHPVQGIMFGVGRASEGQGKEDLRVIPAPRELIAEGRVPCDKPGLQRPWERRERRHSVCEL